MNIKGIELRRKAELNINQSIGLDEFERYVEKIKEHCKKCKLECVITSIYKDENSILNSLEKDLKLRKDENQDLLKIIYGDLINKGLILKLDNNIVIDFREYCKSCNYDFLELEDAISYWGLMQNKSKVYKDSDIIEFLNNFIKLENYYEIEIDGEHKYVWVGAFIDSDDKIKFNFSDMD